MARFIALIDYDPGLALYGAVFPDAPGCTAMGETEQEVVDNALEALGEWVDDEIADGREAPVPRSFEALAKAGGLPAGSLVVTIPLVRENGRLVCANISLDAGLLATIDEAAGRIGLTRSAFLASAARDKVKSLA